MLKPAVANDAQTKSGIRVQVMPGARILKIVTRKFSPVSVELMPTRMIAMHHIDVAVRRLQRDRRILGPARVGRAQEERHEQDEAGRPGTIQKLGMLSHGNATSRAPICSGITKLPNAPVTSGMRTSHTIIVPCIENI